MPLRRDLKSIRDLNGSHIPFLSHIRDSAVWWKLAFWFFLNYLEDIFDLQ